MMFSKRRRAFSAPLLHSTDFNFNFALYKNGASRHQMAGRGERRKNNCDFFKLAASRACEEIQGCRTKKVKNTLDAGKVL
ncbi:MAG: hypothetical protein IJO38_00005 [Akkermansia sp.]|nr:hypothetical protein [Akkermansia sp.]